MKSINKTILVGAVGQEPEVRYTQNEMAIANFSLATSKKGKDGSSVTQWHNLVAFGKTAELVQQYVHKGSKLYIEGELQYQEYEKDGEKRFATKIIIHDMSFLGDRGNHAGASDTGKAHGNNKQAAKPAQSHWDAQDDDSIPF